MINFSKLHGAGNDFIIMKSDEINNVDYSQLAKKVCDRHFGIGADGLMIVDDSKTCDVKMIYFNSDGSKAKMCGNGIRCFSKYVYDKGLVKKEEFLVETLDGIKNIKMLFKNDKLEKILVNMGKPILNPNKIPVLTDKERFINETIIVDDFRLIVSSILMGVPHTVIFQNKIEKNHVYKIGPLVEKHKIFPNKTNVNFVQVVNRNCMKVDTWERGAGKTLACGTGVCASVYIANLLGYVEKEVKVHVPGGELDIRIDSDENIFMAGKAEFICDGQYYINEDLKKI